MDCEEKARILRARRKALARPPAGETKDDEAFEVVEFTLSHERYALELAHIREVCPLKNLTPIPGTPDFVLGIVSIRGEILSIVDIRKFFDLPEKGLTQFNQIIVLQSEEMGFGILADHIIGTRSIPVTVCQPSLPTLTGMRADYLKGVTGDRLVVLDGEKILSDERIVVR